MKKREDSSETEEKIVSGPIKWIAATTVGLSTSIASFVTAVRKEFELNIVKFPEIKNYREKTYEPIIEQTKALRDANKIDQSKFRHELSEAKKKYFDKIGEVSEHYAGVGGEKKWLEDYTVGSIKRFETLSPHHRTPIVFSAIATCAVGFAGTIMFANSLSSRNHLRHIEAAMNKKENDTAISS